MSKSNAHENGLMLLTFNNTNEANIGDATGLRGSTTAGSLYVSLHSADPGEAGNQGTSEITVAQHGAFARQAVARSGAGWTVATNSATNAAAITFPTGTAGSGTVATHFSVGVSPTLNDTGVALYTGELIGPGTVVTIDTTAETFTAATHPFTVGQAVFVRVTDGTLPAPLAAATTYFVITVNTNDFQLSLTQGGAAVNLTTVGTGTIKVHLNKNIPVGLNTIPTINIGQLVCTED